MPEPKSTILVVDDELLNLKVMLSFLESYKFQIRVANSGERALKALEAQLPDLILLDVMMPGMNGFETCRRIKANAATADVPVIFMTVLDRVEDKVAGFEAGGVDYITKPFEKVEVLSRLRTHLKLRKQQQKLNQAFIELQKQSETLEQQVQDRTFSLQESNRQMSQQRQEIQEKNIALKVVLDQHRHIQQSHEDLVATQLKQLVYPYLELLQQNVDSAENREYVALITSHLDSIVGSFLENSFSPAWKLTAKESLVADLVKKGKNTREIGAMLNISPRTAETYRNTIRKKIGLTNTKTRLQDFLCSKPL